MLQLALSVQCCPHIGIACVFYHTWFACASCAAVVVGSCCTLSFVPLHQTSVVSWTECLFPLANCPCIVECTSSVCILGLVLPIVVPQTEVQPCLCSVGYLPDLAAKACGTLMCQIPSLTWVGTKPEPRIATGAVTTHAGSNVNSSQNCFSVGVATACWRFICARAACSVCEPVGWLARQTGLGHDAPPAFAVAVQTCYSRRVAEKQVIHCLAPGANLLHCSDKFVP